MTDKRARKRLDRKDKYVGMPHWVLTCAAWKALPAIARITYIEAFEIRYNGCNNGDIHLSEREVADAVGCARETASKAIDALVDHGFLRPHVKGRFHVKTRYSTRWILTRYEHQGQIPTMDFMRWHSESKSKQRNQNLGQTGLEIRPDGPVSSLYGLETSPDSADSTQSTGPESSPVLVYHGRPQQPRRRSRNNGESAPTPRIQPQYGGKPTLKLKLQCLLADARQPLSRKDVIAALDVGAGEAQRALTSLVELGIAEKVGYGRYRAVARTIQ